MSTDGGQSWTATSVGTSCAQVIVANQQVQNELFMGSGTCPNAGIFRSTDGGQSWSTVAAGLSGPVDGFAIDPRNSSTIYAAVQGVGVEVSADGGATWTLAADQGLSDLGVHGLTAVNTGTSTEVVVGTNGGRVFESTNGGATWMEQDTGLPFVAIFRMDHDPSNPQILYAGLDEGGGFYRSTDNGAHWSRSVAGMGVTEDETLLVGPDGTVWGGFNGLWMSTDQGQSWGEQDHKAGELAGNLSVSGDGALYASSYPEGPWQSTDHGQDWPIIDENGPVLGPEMSGGTVVAAPTNPQHLYLLGGNTIFASTNEGAYWTAVAVASATPHQLAGDPADEQTVWLATDNGVQVSHDGGSTWQSAGLSGTVVTQIAVANTTPRTLFATVPTGANQAAGVWKSGDGGCGCFPGETGVATPRGLVAIDRLHVGDQVLAEDPATGKVAPERVQAVIDDGIKPLMTVALSDGSSLRVTTNHPFYVDGGPGITSPEWVQAGDLKKGDRLRTEDGRDVTVVALRYHTGTAHVYTLTVAIDHTFFVGDDRVLVHNCNLYNGGIKLTQKQSINLRRAAQRIWERTALFRASGKGWQIHHRITLEYSNLFADTYDPNRLSNLVAMPVEAHTMIEREWTTWRVQNPNSSAASVLREAMLLDQRYGRDMHYLSRN